MVSRCADSPSVVEDVRLHRQHLPDSDPAAAATHAAVGGVTPSVAVIMRGSAHHCDSDRRRPDRCDPPAATEPKAYSWRSLRGVYVSFGHSEKRSWEDAVEYFFYGMAVLTVALGWPRS
jgi:hypothetical protein